MVAAVAVQNIYIMNFVKIVLQSISCKYACNTGVKACAEECGYSCLFKLLFICPLIGIVKISREAKLLTALFIILSPLRLGYILRLVICGVDIINLCFKAGVHNCEILIRKRKVQYSLRLVIVYELYKLVLVICVNLSGCYNSLCFTLKLFLECIAL